MLNLIEVRNAQGSLLGLPLDDISNGLVVEEVEGLDPVKATLVSSSFAQLDGEQYQSSKRERRDITLKIGLEPDYETTTVRDLRKRIYEYFMPKTQVTLRFYMSDGLTVEIQGRVESCETALFSAEPTMDISVACFDSDFYEIEPVVYPGNTTSTEFGQVLPYNGTVETGIEFVLNVNRDISEFTIYHNPPDGSLRSLEFSSPLTIDDVLTITTTPGNKSAMVTKSGQDGSVLYGISPQSNWIELLKGDNNIRVYAEGLPIPYTITYTNKYGGL